MNRQFINKKGFRLSYGILLSLLVLAPFKDVKAISAAQYIKDLAETDTVNMVADDPGHNVRYIGSNPNNYVEFNNEEWRIIGVIDGKVKLLRSGYIESSNSVAYSWDTSPSSVNNGSGINYWAQADLMTELNTDYLNSDLSEDVYWYNSSFNSKSRYFDHTKVIKADAKNLIADATWYLGSGNYDGTTLYDIDNLTASIIYNNERKGTPAVLDPGTNQSNDGIIDRDPTWTGKVALPYASDFLYSSSGNSTTNRSQCLNTTSWNADCYNNSWMKDSYDIWTMTPTTMSGRNIYVFYYYSSLANSGLTSWPTNKKTKPAIYLKDNVVIYDGDGTSTNRYKLALANVVEFDTNGGSEVSTQYIEANEKVTEPTTPTKEDSTFLGWFTDPELTNQYDFNTTVTGNFKLYAKWQFNYKIIEGADQTFENNDITIKTNGDLSKLLSIKDNGEVIDPSNYTLESGSTILTIKSSYLSTLANGTHTITFVYNDGSVSTTLTIINNNVTTSSNSTNPNTGDNVMTYVLILALSITGFVIGLFFKKKSLIINN